MRVLKSLEQVRPISRQNSEQMLKNFVKIKSQNSSACSNYRKSPSPSVRKLGITLEEFNLINKINKIDSYLKM